MEKLKLHTPDLTEQNIARIAELFPGCVTEAAGDDGTLKQAIDFDQLRQELSDSIVDGSRERYHLDWPGKKEALLAANAPIAKTLRPCRDESVDFDTTKNLFIEGDNLDALKLLQETYLNKVKMIYIDPPYNTGKDFIYSDNFSIDVNEYDRASGQRSELGSRLVANPESHGRFHSDWLSMLYPRIRLARHLLREDGVIFITIDDGEVANLRRVCDEVFGADNFVTTIAWQKKVSPSNDATWFSNDHDHILVYAKHKLSWSPNRLPLNERQRSYYTNPDNDPRGPWNSATYTCNKTNTERPNLYYPIRNPNTGEDVWPKKTAVWAYSREVQQRHAAEGLIYWGKEGTSQSPRRKKFLTDAKGVVPRTVWPYSEVGHTQEATKELRKMLPDVRFETPKPPRLIEQMLKLSTDPSVEDIVLDFFAGSATTAQAVLAVNARDDRNLRFIMVQLPEIIEDGQYATIAEIGKERIRRAGKKINEENATTAPDLDIGFRVLKVDTSNMKDVYYSADAAKQADLLDQIDNIKEDRTPEDLLFQVLLDWGVDLSLPIAEETIDGKTVFFVDENALAACFDRDIDEELVKKLAQRKPLRAVFRDAGYGKDSVKINVEQIFKLISPATEVKSI